MTKKILAVLLCLSCFALVSCKSKKVEEKAKAEVTKTEAKENLKEKLEAQGKKVEVVDTTSGTSGTDGKAGATN